MVTFCFYIFTHTYAKCYYLIPINRNRLIKQKIP